MRKTTLVSFQKQTFFRPSTLKSLLQCTQAEEQYENEHFGVNAAFVLLCLFHESLKETLFFSFDQHMKMFISNGIVFQILDQIITLYTDSRASQTLKAIKKFVTTSKVLPKYFRSKCNKFLGSTKKNLRKIFSITLSVIAQFLPNVAMKVIAVFINCANFK